MLNLNANIDSDYRKRFINVRMYQDMSILVKNTFCILKIRNIRAK